MGCVENGRTVAHAGRGRKMGCVENGRTVARARGKGPRTALCGARADWDAREREQRQTIAARREGTQPSPVRG